MKPETRLQVIAVRDIGKYGLAASERHEELNGSAIDIAGDELTGPEAAAVLTEVTGRQINFYQVPIEQVRAGSEDFALMLEWFDAAGYDADVDKTARAVRREAHAVSRVGEGPGLELTIGRGRAASAARPAGLEVGGGALKARHVPARRFVRAAKGQAEPRLVGLPLLATRRLVHHEITATRLNQPLEPLDGLLHRRHVLVRVVVAHVDSAREQPSRHVSRHAIALGVVVARPGVPVVDHLNLLCMHE